jgi:quinol monooxygenase YgiN
MADAPFALAMVRLSVTLVASPMGARPLLDAFRSLMVPVRLERGCLGCLVWEETDDDTTLHYAEEWASESDMKRRVQSDRFTSLLAVMEAAAEPPEVYFDFVARRRGLDYVAELRHCGGGPWRS